MAKFPVDAPIAKVLSTLQWLEPILTGRLRR
jgi:hypothetical protein